MKRINRWTNGPKWTQPRRPQSHLLVVHNRVEHVSLVFFCSSIIKGLGLLPLKENEGAHVFLVFGFWFLVFVILIFFHLSFAASERKLATRRESYKRVTCDVVRVDEKTCVPPPGLRSNPRAPRWRAGDRVAWRLAPT